MKPDSLFKYGLTALAASAALGLTTCATAQTAGTAGTKPNIILIVSDDFGYGDAGPYGGGIGRGMPTPAIDRMAQEGMTFFDFYAQPSCTAAMSCVKPHRRFFLFFY